MQDSIDREPRRSSVAANMCGMQRRHQAVSRSIASQFPNILFSHAASLGELSARRTSRPSSVMTSFLPNFCSSKIAAEPTNCKRLMTRKSHRQCHWECARTKHRPKTRSISVQAGSVLASEGGAASLLRRALQRGELEAHPRILRCYLKTLRSSGLGEARMTPRTLGQHEQEQDDEGFDHFNDGDGPRTGNPPARPGTMRATRPDQRSSAHYGSRRPRTGRTKPRGERRAPYSSLSLNP